MRIGYTALRVLSNDKKIPPGQPEPSAPTERLHESKAVPRAESDSAACFDSANKERFKLEADTAHGKPTLLAR